jgi:hypothetical protein
VTEGLADSRRVPDASVDVTDAPEPISGGSQNEVKLTRTANACCQHNVHADPVRALCQNGLFLTLR